MNFHGVFAVAAKLWLAGVACKWAVMLRGESEQSDGGSFALREQDAADNPEVPAWVAESARNRSAFRQWFGSEPAMRLLSLCTTGKPFIGISHYYLAISSEKCDNAQHAKVLRGEAGLYRSFIFAKTSFHSVPRVC